MLSTVTTCHGDIMGTRTRLAISILFTLILFALVAVGTNDVSGEILIVSQDEQGDFVFIQEAIGHARDGDTIRVYDGVYQEQVVVDKSINLIGNGSGKTTIHGSMDGNVVVIRSDGVTFSGFTIRESGTMEDEDTGIRVESDHVTISSTQCTGNRNGIVLVETFNTTLMGNNCSGNINNGIVLDQCLDTIVEDTLCMGNEEAGIIVATSGNTLLRENSIWENLINGVLLINSPKCTAEKNSVMNNEERGISLLGSNDSWVVNNTCLGNNYHGIYFNSSSDGYVFNNTCMYNEDGIYLEDSTDISLVENICDENENGIRLHATESCMIDGNSCEGSYYQGIDIWGSTDITITNNTCSSTFKYSGIRCEVSNNCTINNNTCNSNPYYGINLWGSSDFIIADNGLESNGFGMYLERSDHLTVVNNTCMNGEDGIHLAECDNTTIVDNLCDQNRAGINVIRPSPNNTIVHNSCIGNEIYGIAIQTNSPDIIVSDNTCSDNEIGIYLYRTEETIVRNNTCFDNAQCGIYVDESVWNIIEGNNLTSNYESNLLLIYSDNNTLQDNFCISGEESGIGLLRSSYNDIQNNTCRDNQDGIYLVDLDWDRRGTGEDGDENHRGGGRSEGLFDGSNFNNLFNNNCSNNEYGIYLEFSTMSTIEWNVCNNNVIGMFIYESPENTIENNTCEGNSNVGILLRDNSDNNSVQFNHLENDDYGLFLEFSDGNSLIDNDCSGNFHGIWLRDSDNNLIKENQIFDNEDTGILIQESASNHITGNEVYFNREGIFLKQGSGENIIDLNSVFDNEQGIFSSWSSYNTIANNTVNGNEISGITFSNYCFLGGTLILMADLSEKPIEDVEPGDLVRSYDDESGEMTTTIIQNTFHHASTPSYLIINEESENLRLTPNHPMYVDGNWVDAGDIVPGDLLMDSSGSAVRVRTIDRVIADVPVYNLEVSGPHTYFANDLLTHNKCPRIFSDTGNGYEFDVLINVFAVGEDNDNLYEYPLDLLEKPNILVKYDPKEINFIDFIKLIVEDEPNEEAGPLALPRITILEPIACEAIWSGAQGSGEPGPECDLQLLLERDGEYVLSDAEHPEFSLTFEEFPELAEGYERTISIFSSGYQIMLEDIEQGYGSEEEDREVQEFIEEYFSQRNRNPYDDRSGRKFSISNSYNTVIHNDVFENGLAEVGEGEEWIHRGGIVLWYEDLSEVRENDVHQNYIGINLEEAWDNVVAGNEVYENENAGIRMDRTEFNVVEENDCLWNDVGILVERSWIDRIANNRCGGNTREGLMLLGGEKTQVIGNSCEGDGITGMLIRDSVDVTLANNTIENCSENGLVIEYCLNATLTGNDMFRNPSNFWLWGNTSEQYYHSIDNTNRAGGPIRYLVNETDIVIEGGSGDEDDWFDFVGTIYAIHCENLQFSRQTLSENGAGIFLWGTNNSLFENLDVRENRYGLYADNGSHGNRIVNSTIHDNTEYGINAENNSGFHIEASFNDWGDESGPNHPTLNPTGLGDPITDNVRFTPWLPLENIPPVATIISITPSPAMNNDTVVFVASGSDHNGTIEAYSWRSSIDGILSTGDAPSFERTNLTPGNHTIFLRVQDDRGAWSGEMSTILTVTTPEQPPLISPNEPEEPGEEDDPPSPWILLLILLISVALLLRFSFLPLASGREVSEKDDSWF